MTTYLRLTRAGREAALEGQSQQEAVQVFGPGPERQAYLSGWVEGERIREQLRRRLARGAGERELFCFKGART